MITLNNWILIPYACRIPDKIPKDAWKNGRKTPIYARKRQNKHVNMQLKSPIYAKPEENCPKTKNSTRTDDW